MAKGWSDAGDSNRSDPGEQQPPDTFSGWVDKGYGKLEDWETKDKADSVDPIWPDIFVGDKLAEWLRNLNFHAEMAFILRLQDQQSEPNHQLDDEDLASYDHITFPRSDMLLFLASLAEAGDTPLQAMHQSNPWDPIFDVLPFDPMLQGYQQDAFGEFLRILEHQPELLQQAVDLVDQFQASSEDFGQQGPTNDMFNDFGSCSHDGDAPESSDGDYFGHVLPDGDVLNLGSVDLDLNFDLNSSAICDEGLNIEDGPPTDSEDGDGLPIG